MTTLVKPKKGRYPWLGPEFSNFFGEDDFFNDRFWHKNVMKTPAINVREIDDYYLVELAAPGLTKKDLPRGHWRHLTEQEVVNLKNIK